MSSHPVFSYTMPGSTHRALLQRSCRYALFLLLGLAWMGLLSRPAHAQVVPFNIIGHIQTFTEDVPGLKYGGAHMTVNGINVTIPKNTVLVMPAAYFTVDQLFAGPHGTTPPSATRQSGLALLDIPPPIAAFEATIAGNIVNGVHIAGLVFISQHSLQTTDGFIKAINYPDGFMCVGSAPGALPFSVCATGRGNALVQINDPKGRYGLATTLRTVDQRFQVDPDNPTIHAANGYPMCVPRKDPALGVDPLCPITNRQKDLAVPGKFLTQFLAADPLQQVPLVVGDYITFSGTLARNINGAMFVSAHTINANVAAFTPTGQTPYLYIEGMNLGAGPTLVCPGAECTNRTVDTGFTTDPSQTANAAVYALDVGQDGIRRTRKLVVPSIRQAVVGRFRLLIDKAPQLLDSINPTTGLSGGAPRELMFRIDPPGGSLPDGSLVPDAGNSPGLVRANGLIAGQYVAPNFDYLFAEGQPGAVPPTANFQCLAFLTNGWGIKDPLDANASLLNIGQLSPWPGATPPTTVNCKTNP